MSGEANNNTYISGTLNVLNPWGSRTATPKTGDDPSKGDRRAREGSTVGALPEAQKGGDHSASHGHRLRIKNYPKDCPILKVQWFHAVDVSYVMRQTPYLADDLGTSAQAQLRDGRSPE